MSVASNNVLLTIAKNSHNNMKSIAAHSYNESNVLWRKTVKNVGNS